jgi:hypothetical protein
VSVPLSRHPKKIDKELSAARRRLVKLIEKAPNASLNEKYKINGEMWKLRLEIEKLEEEFFDDWMPMSVKGKDNE